MSGKGDTPRPKSVDAETFAERWARTFGQQRHEDARETLRQDNLAHARRVVLGDDAALPR